MDNDRLDLKHLQCIGAILDGIPGDTELPRAILALEDAMMCCVIALWAGVSLQRARELHHKKTTHEETQQMLAEHKESVAEYPTAPLSRLEGDDLRHVEEAAAQGDGDPRPIHGMGAVEDDEPPDTTRPGRRW